MLEARDWDRELRELENSVAFVVGDHEFTGVIRAAREEIESLRAFLTRVEEERDADQHVLRAVRDWIAIAEFDDGSPTNCPVSAIAPTGLLAAVERCLSRATSAEGKTDVS